MDCTTLAGDVAYEIEEKVEEYLRAGVKLVWVVSPKSKTVRIHRAPSAGPGPIITLRETDTISGDDVLPDFRCAVSEFFQI